MTSILSGSAPAENRLKDYIRLGCNQTYYDVNYEKHMSEQCIELLHTVGIVISDGASGKGVAEVLM